MRITGTASRKVESPFDVLDVNQDGAVTSSDITAIYDVLLGNGNRYRPYSDVNGDGSVTAADITTIYNYILGN